MLHNGRHIFSDEDDERLVNIVDTMIDKELLPHQEIADWISGLAQCCNLPRSRSQVNARVNSKDFLRSLYFRRGQDGRGIPLFYVKKNKKKPSFGKTEVPPTTHKRRGKYSRGLIKKCFRLLKESIRLEGRGFTVSCWNNTFPSLLLSFIFYIAKRGYDGTQSKTIIV